MKKRNEYLDNKAYIFVYYPGDSFMHKLNPMSKFLFLLLLTIIIFFIKSLIFLSIIALSIILVALISGISLRDLLRKLKFIVIVLIFSIVLNIFFNAIPQQQEQVLFYILGLKFLPIRRLAVYYAMKAFFIIITLFSSSIIYTNTTNMKDFVYSLMSLKVPYKYSFNLMVGMRYLPLIEKEAKTIALAQKARGFGREKVGSIKKAYNFIFERLVSTLIIILRKAHITSISMENRCFGIHKKRTNLNEIHFKIIDIVFIFSSLCIFSFILTYLLGVLPLPQFPSLYKMFLELF
ncbi:MAG: energy-coupling factor transporter transmembrane component T family protein [Candidatus Odinarchaeota archaeon]